ncbi:MAG: TRAP transporter large permease [Bacteroidetes bacterium]|nr:TRAP transporter large permease [Bacteroidota bacterium]MCW5894866.1 TRAP transporter large permease [Bacteroidota bacterium]
MSTLIAGLLLLLLALLGAPLFAIIGAVAMLSFAAEGIESSAVMVELYRICSNPTLVAIPLFTFAGYVLAESKTPQRLVNLARAFFGSFSGGLAVVALVTCALFTAFTGASGVTIVALGGLLLPILLKEHYPEKFSLGLITTSGSLGLLFPPSLPLILYSVTAKLSIDQLFAAGLIPGILLLAILSVYGVRQGKKAKVPTVPFTWSNVKSAVREAAWEIPLPFIVIGGIYSGTFTATEAAAVTAFYVLVVEVFIYKDLHLFRDIPRVMRQSMVLVGAILMIIGTAMGLTNYLVDNEVPMKLFEFTQSFITNPIMFLIVLNIFLILVGMMMDIFSAIIVVVPLILPIAVAYGVHPVHLGIIFLTNLEIGYLTPPVGLNLFISSIRFQKPVFSIVRAVLPYIGMLLIALLIITYVPWLSLWLVELLGVK